MIKIHISAEQQEELIIIYDLLEPILKKQYCKAKQKEKDNRLNAWITFKENNIFHALNSNSDNTK